MTIDVEPPIAKALRVAGVAVICYVHPHGVEFGYPIHHANLVRRSTGVVCNNDSYAEPTCEEWIVKDDSTMWPIRNEDVHAWTPEVAWRYRLNEIHCQRVGNTVFSVFALPCGVFGVFRIVYPKANESWKPRSVEFVNGSVMAKAWCMQEVERYQKDGAAAHAMGGKSK